MHIVIAGGGEIGSQIAKAIHKDHDVVVVDTNPEVKERLGNLDVQIVTGSITDPEMLREAKVDLCDTFIATTNWDEVNLIACMLAKGLGAKETLCFVGKQTYMDILTDPRTVELLGARIDQVFWPQRSLAREIVEVIRVPGAVDTETLAGGRLRFVEYQVREGGPYAGKELALLDWPDGSFMAGILREGRFMAVTDPGFSSLTLEPEDRIFFMTTPTGFDAIQACFAPKGRVRRVMVVGGGNVGYIVAQELLRVRLEVTIIDHDPDRCAWLAEQLPGALVLEGDGTDLELLEAEGLEHVDAIVAVTENDEKNLLVSLLAKQVGVQKVVTRVNRGENRRLFEHVGIDIPLTPRAAAVREVVDWLSPENVDHLALFEDKVELLEFELPGNFREIPFENLQLPRGAVAVALERGTKVYLRSPQLAVTAGDKLLVLTDRQVSNAVLEQIT
ncbi:Trk system potassium transporter TrkA [Meiothermus granaticius]|uniref:Trk system potassium uptake protein TrkA n=1 Tax=Meiothermus granaticius NBRC 107808 TaxID=1227551 RepID=A0A399FF68_9DEIN|nr:Trk system potassium transporter TrkA [Meiothermus granaticius]RIH93882.1 Trk system potassium uptake protein TrkA [Meiothermus granaticius NBRC 107808]GEM86378.1 Trk system potassium transport protein TrkA [Meiothermus granaticius NBRC 107808]